MKVILVILILIVSAVWIECLLTSDLCRKNEKSTCNGTHKIPCGSTYCAFDSTKCIEFTNISFNTRSVNWMSVNINQTTFEH